MTDVGFEQVTKTFGDVTAVQGVDLKVAAGEFMVLLGPSGCGKTTLLRCLAGLETVDRGRVRIGDRDVTDLPPRRRSIAMVFQSYAVFPHLTVYDNIAFGLRMRKEKAAVVDERVRSSAGLLRIADLADRYPAQLSGGQRQRVAVARALATKADVLLMDEPLSNLDALLRLEARAELKRLLGELGQTTIYVTHDQTEAMSMGDRVAVMNAGVIVQAGAPLAVYDHPADTFVGGFIGSPPMNFVACELVRGSGPPAVAMSGGTLPLPDAGLDHLAGRELLLGIRAENIEVHTEPAPDRIAAQMLVCEPLGSHNLLTVRVHDDTLKVIARPDLFPPVDSEVHLRLDPDRIRWMDRRTGAAVPAGAPATR